MVNRYAVIDNQMVINVIVADEDFILANYPEAVLCSDDVCPGWAHDGETFYIPEQPQPMVIDEAETI